MMAAWNAGDVDAFVQYWHPDAMGFWYDGGLLGKGGEYATS